MKCLKGGGQECPPYPVRISIRLLPITGLLLLLLILTNGCNDNAGPSSVIADVAVYVGPGSLDASVTASLTAVEYAGYSVDTIGVARVRDGELSDYRAVLFPGGDARDFSSNLGSVGRMKLKSYVASGGGFIGFGGGSVIADSTTDIYPGIGLFNGVADWPVDLIAIPVDYTIIAVQLIDDMHPTGKGGLNDYQTLYIDGPQFQVSDHDISIIYNYVRTDTPAAIAFEYAQGRIFLTGFQPEFEENDSRDSTDFGQELDDPDSEWDMIERALGYCLWEL